jgi:V8-like Glu-specific endopeptidase
MEVPDLRRASILFLICALALVAAGVPAAPAQEPRPERASPSADVRTHVVRGARHATDYWTKERMKDARPAPTPRVGTLEVDGQRRATSATAPYPFTRTEITTPGDTQYRMHGKVFFTDPFDGNDYVCSGTVVTSTNESLVWTAGHCVFLNAWHRNWVFVPGFQNGNAPFGEWPALYTNAPERWVTGNNIRQDMGVAVVSTDPATGASVQAAVGSREIAFNGSRFQAYSSFGYPADRSEPEFTGQSEFVCQSNYAKDDVAAGGSGPLPIAIGCDMTGGSSGGGWVGPDGRLYSVNSYGYDDEPEVMYGPYFGDVAQALYTSSEAITPHAMAVSIRLRKHLIVSGTLVAEDGYTPCAQGALIEVWRRGSRGWTFLKSERTNSLGRYSIKVKDRPGRYEVVAPDGPVDDLNYCTIAFSRVLRHRH